MRLGSFFGKAAFFTALALSLAFISTKAHADKTIPPPPKYYVLDEPRVLDAASKRALESLLIEHDHATGEQFLIAIFNSLEGEDPVEFTNQVFSKWGVGKRGKDDGVLLALYWKEHKSRIEVGYGLESLLTDAKSKLILTDTIAPELRSGNPGRALALGALEILKTIQSPLIDNGQAQEILRSGQFSSRVRNESRSLGWGVWVFLGFIFFIIVLNLLTARDAHFTGSGWFRPRPLSRRRGWGGWSGGGWDAGGMGGGSWGGGWGGSGGGGFVGGGGSSGGGGASGDW